MSSPILENTYEIREKIGSGGGGIIYLAWHIRLNKWVILKKDKRGLSIDIDKLNREANALKNLSHTYIPQVYDFIVKDGNAYTVIDYIEGESFNKILAKGQRFPQSMVVKWLRQILEAVAYLHSNGVLHSDIKPANIMLRPNGDICLIDFNIALALGDDGVTAIGISQGYASPEHYGAETLAEATGYVYTNSNTAINIDPQKTIPFPGNETTVLIRKESPYKHHLLDVRSDIYSLGATIYHILSGIRPAVKAREIIPLSKKEYSVALVDVIMKAMNPNPDLRYQTANEMLEAVNHLHKADPRYQRFIRNLYLGGTILGLLFVSSGFCTFTGLKRMEREKEALVQAEYSAKAMADGNITEAVRYALESLSEKGGIFTPSPPTQAQKALTDALQVYDLSDGYKQVGILELPSPPLKLEISPESRWAAAVYAYEAALIDLQTSEVIAALPMAKSALADVVFTKENRLIYAGEKGICCYDIAQRKELWQGKPATTIAVSANGKIIAAVNKDDREALLYTIDGQEKGTVSFQEKFQRIPMDDSMGDPQDALFCLNKDGTMLAASFADGSLDLFHLDSGEIFSILLESGAEHFEGGFSQNYFAFSAVAIENKSVFAAINTDTVEQTGGFQSDNPFGVVADETGIYISSGNLVVKLNPENGGQQEFAYTSADIEAFSHDKTNFIAVTKNNELELFQKGIPVGKYIWDHLYNFLCISGDYVLAGTRDSPYLRVLQKKDFSENDFFHYDAGYFHNEARINAAQNRILLYSYQGFRLYDTEGKILCDKELPDAQYIIDQQYSHTSGNLAVIYKNSLRIYDGSDGNLLFEKTGLQSVFYAPYGISILEPNGKVSLIDIDSTNSVMETQVQGNFAVLCGMVIDQEFLKDQEVIGAANTKEGYLFAVSNGIQGIIYNGKGKKLFSFDVQGKSEAFFTDEMVLISPFHGTPAAYSLKTGKKINNLQPDSFLTYATQTKEGLLVEYISADGNKFGILLDSNCESLAQLPDLTDFNGEEFFFDYPTGVIRKSHLYSLTELRERCSKEGFTKTLTLSNEED